MIKPACFTIEDLLRKNLKLPDFQRPYEWSKEHVELLIEDLLEAYDRRKENYLLGNMIFYIEGNDSKISKKGGDYSENSQKDKNSKEYQIIDGQQRIITLGLILYFLEEKENNFIKLKVDSIHSTKNIISNYRTIRNRFKNYNDKGGLSKFIRNNVIITALITDDLDQAFFLFDSQNTRGEPLKSKDLLKVHHIRGVENDEEKEFLIKNYWEKYERFKEGYKIFDLLEELLQLLSISRKALRGELKGDDLVEIDVYKEFFAEVKKGEKNKLNNYNQPPLFEDFSYDIKTQTIEFSTKKLTFRYPSYRILDGWKFLPFEIPQSIEEGEKFFYYLIKYINTYQELNRNYSDIFSLFDNLWHSGNIFLNKIYKSLLLLYYDKFGKEMLENFAYRLIIIFTHYGNEKIQIRKEGIVNSFANPYPEKISLFNLIFSKYYPILVIENLDKYIQFEVEDLKIKYSENTRLGSFIAKWHKNNKIKDKVFEVLNACGRNWKIEESSTYGE